MTSSVAAAADGMERKYQFDIPAETLGEAVSDFSQISSQQIIFSEDLLKGRAIRGLHGSYTARDALNALLAGTGLRVETDATGVLMIKKAERVDSGETVETVVVLGLGETRQTQTIKPAELGKQTPGTSPLQILAQLPGVDFQSSDPIGGYEWAQQVTIRGFTTEQMGYTLDGVPLGNMQYRNNNGLSINRALQAENNGSVTLSQGSAALGTVSTSNIGGTIDFTSIDPTMGFGVDIAQTYGSSANLRTFARVNSGTLPGNGRFYISYDHQQANKWKGYGSQDQDQINFKFIQPLSDRVTATTYVDAVDRREDDYMDVSFSVLNRLGYRVDQISNNFALAESLAEALQNGMAVPAPYRNGDDVFYNGGGVRQDILLYEKLDYSLIPALEGQTTFYWHRDHGIGTFADSYDPTPAAYGGSPISVSTVGYDIDRTGFTSHMSYVLGSHKLEAGIWYEHNNFDQIANLYGLQKGVAPTDFERFYSDPFRTRWHYVYNSDVYQFHIGDSWDVTDALHIDIGVKSLFTRNNAKTITSSQPINGTIKADGGLLPTVAALYKFDSSNEVFADYTRNMSAFVASAASGPFSTTQAGFDYIHGNLKPEKTHTFETGYRFNSDLFQASIVGYYVLFENRLLASSISSSIVGNQNVLQNVGGVTSRGVEAAASWHFAPNWSLYGTWSNNDAHYNDDVAVANSGTVIATKGKQVVAAPRNVGSAQISYDDGALWSQLSAHYHGRRYYTYLNNSPVSGAVVADFNAGYRFHGDWLEGSELALNITNLFDKRYIASVGTSGFVNSDPTGSYSTLQVAAPRQFFVTLRKHF